MSVTPLEAIPLDQLRLRSSTKWRKYPADVIPMFVAETDFPLAPAISRTLARAVELGDTGYTPPDPGVAHAYVDFAERRFGWAVDPARIRTTCDVMMGVVEILRHVTNPGDRVVITTPVYPPFFTCVEEAGAVVEDVPLADTGAGWELDLLGIEAALADGARAVLLCNPHNPTGTVHSRETLAALADLAAEYGAAVISDEIHAPLAHSGVAFTPFLDASPTAARVGYAIASASKAFNLAGLKCALMITAAEETARIVRSMPDEVEWRTSLFGAMAAVAAFSEESDAWLDGLLATLDGNRRLATSTGALTGWNPEGRPVPVPAATAALSAVQDGADALLVDLAGPVRFVVEGEDLACLARGWRLVRLEDGWGWLATAGPGG